MRTNENCQLCGRNAAKLQRHHLIPRTRHNNKKNKRNFEREDVHGRILMLCSPCHKTVHAVLTEKELEYAYNEADRLRQHPEIAKFIKWVRKIPPGQKVPVHGTSDQRERRKSRRRT
ncbi:MAG: hypothetical protein ACOC93_04705 [Planctomycetota bacterium]